RFEIPRGPGGAEVAEDLLLRVGPFHVPDEEHRLALEVGEAGHNRVVVRETAVAVDLGEAGEERGDVPLEPWTVRMPRDEHALPRREGVVQVGPGRFEAASPLCDFAATRRGGWQRLERLAVL